jgi:hypothetical protein
VSGNRSDSVNYLLDGGLNNDLLDNGVVYNPKGEVVETCPTVELADADVTGRLNDYVFTSVKAGKETAE